MKKIFLYISIISIVIVLNACSKNKSENESSLDSVQENGLNFAQTTQNAQTENSVSDTLNSGQEMPLPGFTINNSNIYEMNDKINIDGIEFSNLTLTVSKDILNGILKDDIIYFDEETDDNGRLLQEQSYIFADITLNNTTSETVEIYLSFGTFIVLNSENEITDSSIETRYRSDYTSTDPYRKDYFKYSLAPNSSSAVTIGYIVRDTIINSNDLYYMINKDGYGPGYDQFKAFTVDL